MLNYWISECKITQKTTSDSHFKPRMKINLNGKDLNVKLRTIKLLEENKRENLCGVGSGQVFLGKISKV